MMMYPLLLKKKKINVFGLTKIEFDKSPRILVHLIRVISPLHVGVTHYEDCGILLLSLMNQQSYL